MNSTFKVTPAGTKFDIIHYTGPPTLKPRGSQVSQRREAIPEKCSLPDLAPNSLFDELDGIQAQSGIPDPAHTASLDGAYDISSPSTGDVGVVGLKFTAEKPGCKAVPDEMALNEIDESQHSTPGHTPSADSRALDQRKISLESSIPIATRNLGVNSSSPNSGGGAHDENASADNAQSDNGNDFHGRAGKEPGNEELGLSDFIDDKISSDSGTSDAEIGHVVHTSQADKGRLESSQGALQSADSSTRVVIPSGHTGFGQSSPKVVLPYPRASSAVKAPRIPTRATSRSFGREVDHRRPRKKCTSTTVAGQLHVRDRLSQGTTRARVHPDIWPSDSDCSNNNERNLAATNDTSGKQRVLRPSRISKAVGASKWKQRSGDRTSSIDPRRRSGVLLRGAEDSPTATAVGVLHDDDVAAAYDLPKLQNPNIQPMISTEAAVLTVLLDDITEIDTLLQSPAAWGLTGGLFHTARLTNATVKLCPSEHWQLTATFSRPPVVTQLTRDSNLDTEGYSSGSGSDNSSSSMYSVHHCPSEIVPEKATRRGRRGGWDEEDDRNLIKWRGLGKSWPWIYEKFPDRTEGAIKSHWYVVLAPRQKPERE